MSSYCQVRASICPEDRIILQWFSLLLEQAVSRCVCLSGDITGGEGSHSIPPRWTVPCGSVERDSEGQRAEVQGHTAPLRSRILKHRWEDRGSLFRHKPCQCGDFQVLSPKLYLLAIQMCRLDKAFLCVFCLPSTSSNVLWAQKWFSAVPLSQGLHPQHRDCSTLTCRQQWQHSLRKACLDGFIIV